ncbi:glucose-6-phosphate 1-dehydrogenase [Endobacter medicaginis]|uniref:Glucose-6-phosphate 1-dehydrogenase n=2 Tax=Endobacter medicaginis TaxID=1181271 RepID=A0A839UWY8_9PROT|nr:glucose-6-phosphate dehydrogenase [Endobacter medicaginis]MBB3173175.1 glucose-6-phosphate 1-dehydrogenase [Endobacter medicaginis]MCX5476116.1 glucose-6-phosphate dehydrogenase [Endobacter medicaginis]
MADDVKPAATSDGAVATQDHGQHTAQPAGKTPAPPGTLVIFGAHGDLTKRLLTPSLYNLTGAGLLDPDFKVIGVDRVDADDAAWRKELSDTMQEFTKDPHAEFYTPKINEEWWGSLSNRMSYFKADFTDVEQLKALGEKIGDGNAVFYLAVAARFFATVAENLSKAGLTRAPEGKYRRLVVEKPFGADLDSSKKLNAQLLSVLDESQIYRIDHFLGKETVQNILASRFSNITVEPLWNRFYIDHVEITAAETVGVEQRGAFYEPTGALRDMVPNHLFQLLAMVAMEPPSSFSAEAVRSAKEALYESIRPCTKDDAVRGQYTAGRVHDRDVTGYRQSNGVAPTSNTETYVALRLHIDNWRWSGVPFYLRTGKCMTDRLTEVVVQFKRAPISIFRDEPVDELPPNQLILNIQPEQGMTMRLNAKIPGAAMDLAPVEMKFRYEDAFNLTPNVGYETLIYDCLIGDATLFQRADNIDAAWAVVDPVLKAWEADPSGPELYEAGSAGPAGADRLLAADGRAWAPLVNRTPDKVG